MHIILITLFLLGGCIIHGTPQETNSHKKISIWGGIVLFFYGALRSSSVGIDVGGYVSSYLSMPYVSFQEIFTSATAYSRDPVFYVFLKLLTFFSANPQLMLIVISAIVAICVSIFIYKNSVNAIVSFMMFIGLRYYSFTLTGLRQAIAWAILMLSYNMIKEKKPIKFFIMVLFASLFHKSALVFLLAYPLAKVKTNIVIILTASFLLINYILFSNNLVGLLSTISLLAQYEGYLAGATNDTGLTMLIIYLCVFVFAFTMRKRITGYKSNFMALSFVTIGIAIMTLNFSYSNIFRIGYYFILPIIILLPLAVKSVSDKKMQSILNFVVILLLVTQFIIIGPGAGTSDYRFFWQ